MLTPEQLKYFRARLEQQRQALRDTAAQAQRQIAAPDAIADAISDQGDDGNMLFAREEAMNELAQRVIDLYSVKPIDSETLRAAVEATGGRFVVVEDHWPQGGLGEAVLAALSEAPNGGLTNVRLTHLAVNKMPTSGKPDELLHAYGIDAEAIASAVRSLARA